MKIHSLLFIENDQRGKKPEGFELKDSTTKNTLAFMRILFLFIIVVTAQSMSLTKVQILQIIVVGISRL